MAAKKSIAEQINPEMRSPDEELQVRSKSLRAARIKAKVVAREEKATDRRLKMEELRMMRVYPTKADIRSFFMRERSGGMICRDEWYRLHVPEDKDDYEVTLQLWSKSAPGRPPILVGEVGDLYRVELDLPNGSTLVVHIIVKSAEARDNPGLLLQFSVLDLGDCEKAFSVEQEAWQNYLLFRDEDNKEDLDCRLLYHAICNRYEMGDLALTDFAQMERSDLTLMMQRMEPGGDYPRPTVYEAHLNTDPPAPRPTPEMLRAQEDEDADLDHQVSEKLDVVIRRKFGRRPSYKNILEHEEMLAKNLGSPKKKVLKRKRLNPYPRREAFRFHPDIERKINQRLNNYLDSAINSDNKLELAGPSIPLTIKDVENPFETMKSMETKKSPPGSPATLKSWSSSGWVDDNTDDPIEDLEDDVVEVLPLDEDGRIVEESTKEATPTMLKPEKSWLDSIKAAEEVNLVLAESREEQLDETVLSLMSSLSGIGVLDRSSEQESLVRDSFSLSSSDDARDIEADESVSFNDSVDVFLAKYRREEIITVSTSESSGHNSPTVGPVDGASRSSSSTTPKRGPGEITFQGAVYKWNVPPLAAHYPGQFVDDLINMEIPRELWPFPVNGADEVKTPDAGCGECKSDAEKN